MDLTKCHIKAIEKVLKTKGIDAYNLRTGRGCSVLEIVETFKRVNKVDIPLKIVERRPGDIAACYANPSYAKEKLNWQAGKEIEEMCQGSCNFIIQNKDK